MARTSWWGLRAGLVALMLAGAPVLAGSHPAPTDLEGSYSSATGIFALTWEYDQATYPVDEYRVYLDGELLGTSGTTSYDDNLTTWIGATRTYEVTAIVDGDESPKSGALHLMAASTGEIGILRCPPASVVILDHAPWVGFAIRPECLPETEGSGSGGGE